MSESISQPQPEGLIFLWANSTEISMKEASELKFQGALEHLSSIDPALFGDLPYSDTHTNLVKRAERLLHYARFPYVLVNPEGDAAFQCVLGQVMATKTISNMINHVYQETHEIRYPIYRSTVKDMPQDDGSIHKITLKNHIGWRIIKEA